MRLTDVLKQFALVGDAEIEEALKAQKKDKEGLRIGELLCNLGYCSEDQIHWALSQHLNLPYIHVDEVDIDYNAISFFPVAMLKRLGALPLFSDDDGVAIALIDPTDDKAKDELSEYSGQVVKVCMANAKEIRSFLADLEETQIVHLKEVKPLEEEPKEQLEAVSQLWLKVHELWFEKQVRGILEGVSTAELTKKIKAFCPDFSFRPGCSFWEGKSSEQVFWVQITPEFLRLKSAINLDSKIIEKNILKPSPGKWAELNTPSPEKAFPSGNNKKIV